MAYVDDVIKDWKGRPRAVSCSEIREALEAMGFEVKKRNNGNHHTISHPNLKGFFGSNYDCGHSKDGAVKLPYIKSILRVLSEHRDELANGKNP